MLKEETYMVPFMMLTIWQHSQSELNKVAFDVIKNKLNSSIFKLYFKHKGLIKAEDGMRKLRIMEKSQGIWTMECQLMIDTNFLVVYDKKNGVSFFFLS